MTTKLTACRLKLQEANEEILQLHQQLGIYINQRDQLDKCNFERDELSKGLLEVNQEREKCLERKRELMQEITPPKEVTISPHGRPRRVILPPPRGNHTETHNHFGGGSRRSKKHCRKLTRRNIRKRKRQTRKSKTRNHKKIINTRKSKIRRYKS